MGALKKIKKGSLEIVGASVSLGVGSQIIGGVGGATAAGGQRALNTFSNFLPLTATVVAGGATLAATRKLGRQVKKGRRVKRVRVKKRRML